MQSVIDIDEIIDVEHEENSLSSKSNMSASDTIVSKPSSDTSSQFDELELFRDFFNENTEDTYKDDVSFTDCFLDEESLELSSYLGQGGRVINSNTSHSRHGRLVSDLELLDKKFQQQKPLKTHMIIPVNNVKGNLSLHPNDYDPSMSKNAVAARENRLKKKQYVAHLENLVKSLTVENQTFKSSDAQKNTEIEKLSIQVKYLQNVLANQSTISALLRNINKTPGVTFKEPLVESIATTESRIQTLNKKDISTRSGILKRKCQNEAKETSVPTPTKMRRSGRLAVGAQTTTTKENQVVTSECQSNIISNTEVPGGICLHVTGQQVSLEFCAECNHKSVTSDHSYVRQLSSESG